jgi:hypothetical protein
MKIYIFFFFFLLLVESADFSLRLEEKSLTGLLFSSYSFSKQLKDNLEFYCSKITSRF